MSIESLTHMTSGAKPEKREKSQAELRATLENRFYSMESTINEGMKEYKQALENDLFENADDEIEGQGESRKQALQNKLTAILNRAEKLKIQLDSKEPIPQSQPEISTTYTGVEGVSETITLDIESKLSEFNSFYKQNNINLPPDFADTIHDIWEKNNTEILQAMKQNGFDDILIIPARIPLSEIADKMKMENGYYTGSNFDQGGGFAGAISQNTNKPRILLYHKSTLPEINKKTRLDVHLNITAGDAEKLYKQDPDKYMSTLEDFLVMEKKNETLHLADYTKKSGQWLPGTKSGTRIVSSYWHPDDHGLRVHAGDPEYRSEDLGVRPSRCFF